MEAMILAAGRGERMRPLSDTVPKPLVDVGGRALIEHHLTKLSNSGFKHVVINVSYLSEIIIKTLGDGSRYGIEIRYSEESDGPLGTAAGIANALNLFEQDQIFVINADVFSDYPYSNLHLPEQSLAHLIMVNNPLHNSKGDFCLNNGVIHKAKATQGLTSTFSGMALYRKILFDSMPANGEIRELGEVFQQLIEKKVITGELHTSLWIDVGDPERLSTARRMMTGSGNLK